MDSRLDGVRPRNEGPAVESAPKQAVETAPKPAAAERGAGG